MTNHTPILSEQMGDIQGMLNSGFGWLTTSRFWLLTIRDGRQDRARAWFSDLARSNLLVSAKCIAQRKKDSQAPIREAVAIAFSYSGLTKLGLNETRTHPFPSPFRNGMGSPVREDLLRDGSRTHWQWSDVEGIPQRQTIHALIAQWRLPDGRWQMPDPDPEAFSAIRIVDDHPHSFREDGFLYEPFGFRDGIAQPVIRGLREDKGDNPKRIREEAGALYDDRVIAPGEFILGYRNEYNELTYCPDVEQWTGSQRATHPGGHFALNGSYLAVRQIEQDVAAFKALEAQSSKTICEKMMGRRMDGLPLSWGSDPTSRVSASKADAFRFRVEDADGLICPKGSHIRRVNPRDSLGSDVQASITASKLHRLLRRGRPYRELAEGGKPSEGMLFIACNADLERQFEFIHQRWMRNPRFENLHQQDDPIVGSSAPTKTFTIPRLPSGEEISLATLTQTLGGGYFFLPGIQALDFIADPGFSSASRES
jgi:putative iron-dependent peroxidase